jgi:hypothetical protein
VKGGHRDLGPVAAESKSLSTPFLASSFCELLTASKAGVQLRYDVILKITIQAVGLFYQQHTAFESWPTGVLLKRAPPLPDAVVK